MSSWKSEAKMCRFLRWKRTIYKNYRSIALSPIGLSQEILSIWLKCKECQQFRSQTQGDAKILSTAYNWNIKLTHHKNNAEAQMWNARCGGILAIPKVSKMDFQRSHLQVSFALDHFGKTIKPFSSEVKHCFHVCYQDYVIYSRLTISQSESTGGKGLRNVERTHPPALQEN